MRQFLGVGLAAALGVSGGGASADPNTPQVSPLHRQREDAQRLTEQQRGLDRVQAIAPAPPAKQPPAAPLGGGHHTTRGAGLVLLGIAGLSAAVALPIYAFDSSATGERPDSYGSLAELLLVTSAITGLGGVVLLLSDRTVQVAPAVSAHAVGISVMGRL